MVTQAAPALALPPLVQRLQAAAQQVMTPMASGQMHWHLWDAAPHVVNAAPLVLLHGGSGSWTHWLHNIEALRAAGYRLYLPDLPGFGASDVPPGGAQDAQAMLAPLQQALAQLLGAQAFDLVGFSFGGLLAGLLAAAQPQQVRRLVLVGAPGMGVASGQRIALRGWRHRSSREEQLHIHRANLAALMLHDPARIDDATLALQIHNVERDRLPRRRLAAGDSLAQALRAVPCPVAAICGAHDALFAGDALQRLDRALHASAADCRGLEVLAAAGHWVQYEQPAAFHAALLRALA